MGLAEPYGILIGGFKVTAMENTSSIAVGQVFYQAVDSQSKNNIITGQTSGDFNVYNLQSISSHIFDPDGVDTTMPMIMAPLGLED